MIRAGWTQDVKPGVKVTLTGRRLKSGAPYMNMTERARMILADSGKEVLRNANYGQPPTTGWHVKHWRACGHRRARRCAPAK